MREPPRLTMADMGMAHGDMGHGDMGHGGMADEGMDHGQGGHESMQPEGERHTMADGTVMEGMTHGDEPAEGGTHVMADGTVMEGMSHGTMDHSAHGGMQMAKDDSFYAAGSGLLPTAANGGKFLSYTDLKAQKPLYEDREPTREIELRLTGNMERYIWSINGIKFSDAEPIRLQYGERVRFKFVNETMMTHPMHLHGMWSILDVGKDKWNPAKHVISVSPCSFIAARRGTCLRDTRNLARASRTRHRSFATSGEGRRGPPW